jgi:hypothetical protein
MAKLSEFQLAVLHALNRLGAHDESAAVTARETGDRHE